jgi:hypothetical protein
MFLSTPKIEKLLREQLTVDWMNQNAISKHIHRPFFGPVLEPIPVYTLMWCAKVAERDGLVFPPTHGEKGDVALALEALPYQIKTVN